MSISAKIIIIFFDLVKTSLFYGQFKYGKSHKVAAILVHHRILRRMGLVAAVSLLWEQDNTTHTSLVCFRKLD